MIFSRPLLLKVWSRDQQAQASSETLLDILAPIPGFLNWNLCLSSTLRWFPCNLGFLGFWGHFLFTSCSFYFSQVAHQPPSDSQLSRLGKTKCDTTTLSVTNWKETIPSDSLSLWDFLRGGGWGGGKTHIHTESPENPSVGQQERLWGPQLLASQMKNQVLGEQREDFLLGTPYHDTEMPSSSCRGRVILSPHLKWSLFFPLCLWCPHNHVRMLLSTS